MYEYCVSLALVLCDECVIVVLLWCLYRVSMVCVCCD